VDTDSTIRPQIEGIGCLLGCYTRKGDYRGFYLNCLITQHLTDQLRHGSFANTRSPAQEHSFSSIRIILFPSLSFITPRLLVPKWKPIIEALDLSKSQQEVLLGYYQWKNIQKTENDMSGIHKLFQKNYNGKDTYTTLIAYDFL